MSKLVRAWASGKILTDTAPADRRALKEFVEDYDRLWSQNCGLLSTLKDAEAKLKIAVEALEKIDSYYYKSDDPDDTFVKCEAGNALDRITATSAGAKE